MNINIFYSSAFFISLFIIFLIKKDLEKFKYDIYSQIDNKVWIKVYSIITIGIIHLFWLINAFLLNISDISIIYAFPYYLIIPYILYVYGDLKNEDDESISSKKLNKYLNYLLSLYFILIIILMIIPNKPKENLIKCIKNIIDKNILSKLII
jgi:choline-glycine betaine transporter